LEMLSSERADLNIWCEFQNASEGSAFGRTEKYLVKSVMAKPHEMNTYTKIGGGGQGTLNRNLADGHFLMRYTTIEATVTTEKLWR
jgi:hypothetical protein